MKLLNYLPNIKVLFLKLSAKKPNIGWFVHGNAAEGVPGCVVKGISAETANIIFDEMTDFAKYAFNKAHAACYAVVGYQTAYLKAYYPVEFMAALMTSVIENSGKVARYIHKCRQMGIALIPPDVNEGGAAFTAADKSIRYALSAIKDRKSVV